MAFSCACNKWCASFFDDCWHWFLDDGDIPIYGDKHWNYSAR
jgi:hypothetical protein